jgi:hypothetical protein
VTNCGAPARDRAERRFEALLALVDGEPAGLALFFADFSTWRGAPMHADDGAAVAILDDDDLGNASGLAQAQRV